MIINDDDDDDNDDDDDGFVQCGYIILYASAGRAWRLLFMRIRGGDVGQGGHDGGNVKKEEKRRRKRSRTMVDGCL